MVPRFGFLGLALAWSAAAAAADDPAPTELNRLRLYVPIPQLEARFGTDVGPLTAYIRALDKRAGEILAGAERPAAKGSARVWCEAVDGDVPADLLRRLEKELAEVEGVDLEQAPAGFAMEVNLFGRKPDEYPEFPKARVEAAKKAPVVPLVPPDGLFDRIWPDRE